MIEIRFEDKYGCRELFEKSSKIWNDKDVTMSTVELLSKKENKEKADSETSRNCYINLGLTGMEMRNISHSIVVFDLDSYTDREIMFRWKDLERSFRKKANNSDEGKKLNIFYQDRSDYVGDRIVIIPVFFCFETLYLLDPAFYKIFLRISPQFHGDDRTVAFMYNLPEITLNYINYRNNSSNFLQIQTIYTECTNNIIEIYTAPYDNSSKEVKEKKKYFPQWADANPSLYKFTDLASYVIKNTIFNSELAEMLCIKNQKDLNDFINKYNFQAYKYILRDKMMLYENIIKDDFKTQDVVDRFISLCNNVKNCNTRSTIDVNNLQNNIESYRRIKGYI